MEKTFNLEAFKNGEKAVTKSTKSVAKFICETRGKMQWLIEDHKNQNVIYEIQPTHRMPLILFPAEHKKDEPPYDLTISRRFARRSSENTTPDSSLRRPQRKAPSR